MAYSTQALQLGPTMSCFPG